MQSITNRYFRKPEDPAGKPPGNVPAHKPEGNKKKEKHTKGDCMFGFEPINTLPKVVEKKIQKKTDSIEKTKKNSELVGEILQDVQVLNKNMQAVAKRIENKEIIFSTKVDVELTPPPKKQIFIPKEIDEVKQKLEFDNVKKDLEFKIPNSPEVKTSEKKANSDTEPSTTKKCNSENKEKEKAKSEKKAEKPRTIPNRRGRPNYVRQNLKKGYMQRGRINKKNTRFKKFYPGKFRRDQPPIKFEGLGSRGLDGLENDNKAKASLIMFSSGYNRETPDYKAPHIRIMYIYIYF